MHKERLIDFTNFSETYHSFILYYNVKFVNEIIISSENLKQNALGKNVEIVIFDGTIIRGVLHKTGDEIFKNEPNYYIPKNYYLCLDDNGEYVECISKR